MDRTLAVQDEVQAEDVQHPLNQEQTSVTLSR